VVNRPIQPTGRFGGMKPIRGKRTPEPEAKARVEPAAAAGAPEPVAPIPASAYAPEEAPPVISAQILGQSHTAENASSANIAGKARAVYLGVEWSGPADRRNRRGRIAKTDV
jgi:hypothetical protein